MNLFCLSVTYAQKQVEVSSFEELQRVLTKSEPGNEILLHDGEYSCENCMISGKGSETKSIVIKAKNKGKAAIVSPIEIKGDHLSIVGIDFLKEGSIAITGNGVRISHCTMSDVKPGKWIRVFPGSKNIEIDHNIFKNKYSNKNLERNAQLLQIIVLNENEQHYIHHNIFKNIPEGSGNGFETVQLITKGNPFDPPPGKSNTRIEDNLFLRCNGESEIISVKSNGNSIKRNIFRACKGSLVLRHGDGNTIEGNLFFGDGEKESGGVRLQGADHVVVNNYFNDLGEFGIAMMDGTPDDLYIRVERASILFNTFINCNSTMKIGLNHSRHPNGTVPKDCKIIGNIFQVENNQQDIITFIKNDQPENWYWEHNIAYGNADLSGPEGILVINPQLKDTIHNVAVPTEQTPEVRIRSTFNHLLTRDLLGAKREKKKTIGAIQFPVHSLDKLILTEDNFQKMIINY